MVFMFIVFISLFKNVEIHFFKVRTRHLEQLHCVESREKVVPMEGSVRDGGGGGEEKKV